MRNNASLKMHKLKMPKFKKHMPQMSQGIKMSKTKIHMPKTKVHKFKIHAPKILKTKTHTSKIYMPEIHQIKISSRFTSSRCTRSRSRFKTNYCPRPGSPGPLAVCLSGSVTLRRGTNRPLSMVSFDDFSTFLALRGVFGIYSEWF
jgi:hypothetical protein